MRKWFWLAVQVLAVLLFFVGMIAVRYWAFRVGHPHVPWWVFLFHGG